MKSTYVKNIYLRSLIINTSVCCKPTQIDYDTIDVNVMILIMNISLYYVSYSVYFYRDIYVIYNHANIVTKIEIV